MQFFTQCSVLVFFLKKNSFLFPCCGPPDVNGLDVNPAQDTPVASRKEDTYIHFNIDVEIQRHVEKLPKGMWTNI